VRAAIYARYSTDKQSESSIEDQLRVCRERAEREGWQIVKGFEFRDEGISGAAMGNRPGVQALQRAGMARQFDVALVADLTRLSRSQGDLAKLIEGLRFRGVRVIGVQDGFDSTSRNARMQAGMAGIIGEEFRAMIADRTRLALESRAKAGEKTGGRAYGYGTDRRPVEPAATIAREIFARYASGETMKAIADDLNTRGVPSPGADWNRATRCTHGRWLVSALHGILHNPLYAGRVIWNRTSWVKHPDTGVRECRENPESDWVVHEVPGIALIDGRTWDLVQARLGRNRSAAGAKPGRGGKPRYLLSGLLMCSVCSSKFIVMGGSQHRYTCGAYHAGGHNACSNHISVPRDLAEGLILAPVVEKLLSPRFVEHGIKTIRELARREREAPPAEVSAAVALADAQIAELERLVREGLLTPTVAAPALAKARSERQAALRAPARRTYRTPDSLALEAEAAFRETVLHMAKVLQGENLNEARQLLRDIVGTVRLKPDTDHLIATFERSEIPLLVTGTGRWIGSGGRILEYPQEEGAASGGLMPRLAR
jgi:site-specific DNA recombinase